MATGYTFSTGTTAIALTAGTAKTVLLLLPGSKLLTLCEFGVFFDGVTPTAVPVLVELCGFTMAGAGAGQTSVTAQQIRGDANETLVAAANYGYTTEPTVAVVLKQWLVSPTSGLIIQSPLGREVLSTVAATTARKGIGLRLTAPAGVNARAYMEAEE